MGLYPYIMKDLTLYCNCFPGHLNRNTQFDQKNLMCGANLLKPEERSLLTNMVFDDTGDNISHLNEWLGDLTGLYWVWKNSQEDIVGTNQYRRFWDDKTIVDINFQPNTLYVSNPYHFNNMSAMNQYIMHHGTIGLDILNDAAIKGTIPIKPEMINSLAAVGCLSGCNMFFADRKLFNKTCEILFETVFELYGGVKYSLPYIQMPNQKRLLAFLAERILNIVYLNKDYFYDNINIVPVQMNLIEV